MILVKLVGDVFEVYVLAVQTMMSDREGFSCACGRRFLCPLFGWTFELLVWLVLGDDSLIAQSTKDVLNKSSTELTQLIFQRIFV